LRQRLIMFPIFRTPDTRDLALSQYPRNENSNIEARNSETNSNFKCSKFEISRLKERVLVIWDLNFGYCFGFRHSNFGFSAIGVDLPNTLVSLQLQL
jgi:hypothetical protein